MSDQDARTRLPIADPAFEGTLPFDAKDPNSKFPPIEPLRPPKGAPNVLLVLLDDAGFAAMNTFGGPCTTPTADRLAAGGLTYTRFHVCALCAPTRQRCSPAATIMRLGWARSPSPRLPHRGSTRFGQKRPRRWRRS